MANEENIMEKSLALKHMKIVIKHFPKNLKHLRVSRLIMGKH